MSHLIMRKLEFDAGHRLMGHEGKCRTLHGHRYVCEVYVWSDGLDGVGRVMDFGKIKELCGQWIDTHLDHQMILHNEDPLALDLMEMEQRVFMMNGNPSAENIATLLFLRFTDLLSSHMIRVDHIDLWETPNCKATYPAMR